MYELERIPFVSVSQVLWERSRGDPRAAASPPPASAPPRSAPSPFKGKLSGKYAWPLSVALPHMTDPVSLKDKGVEHPQAYPLPPTFHGKGSFKWAVAYEVKVKIERGFFRSNDRSVRLCCPGPPWRRRSRVFLDSLAVPINYVPLTRPGAMSERRQRAYLDGTPELVGPEGDPDGWASCEPVTLRGTLFGEREVAVTAKVRSIFSPFLPLCDSMRDLQLFFATPVCTDDQLVSFFGQ
jgi:hypothetical protein